MPANHELDEKTLEELHHGIGGHCTCLHDALRATRQELAIWKDYASRPGDIDYEDMRKFQAMMDERDRRIVELEQQLASLKADYESDSEFAELKAQSQRDRERIGELKKYRCEVCDWPLAFDLSKGCVPGNCSYRPKPNSPEWERIKERRTALAKESSDGNS